MRTDRRDERLAEILESALGDLHPVLEPERAIRRGTKRRVMRSLASLTTVAAFVGATIWATAVAAGFAGVTAIAAPSLAEGSNEALGVVLVLAAVGCYGVAINIAAPLTQRYGSLPVMARMLGVASIWTAPFGLVGLTGSSFGWGAFAAMVALGALGTGVAFVLMGRLVGRVGSSRASFATYLIPVVALLLGALFLDEAVEALSVAGIALVIGGALLASRRERAG